MAKKTSTFPSNSCYVKFSLELTSRFKSQRRSSSSIRLYITIFHLFLYYISCALSCTHKMNSFQLVIMNSQNEQLSICPHTSVGRALHLYYRGQGSNPVKAWIFHHLFRYSFSSILIAMITSTWCFSPRLNIWLTFMLYVHLFQNCLEISPDTDSA